MIRMIATRTLGALALAAALSAPAAEAQDRSRLAVTGEGRVAAEPDMAVLRLGVQARAPEAAAAMDEVSRAAAAVIEALRGAGVGEADIQTSELRLGERHDDGRPGAGFEAANVVTARVRDLGALGGAIDAATDAGANRIEGLSFSLADASGAMAEARRRAVADARAAAETLAAAAGATLGPVLRIEEGGGFRAPRPMAGMVRAEAASVPIAAGEVELAARVSMVFALEGTGGAPPD